MAYALITDSPVGTKEQFEQVMQETGQAGPELAPGQLVHIAGPVEGGWLVVTVWESQEVVEKFFNEKVKPARQKAGLPDVAPKTFQVHNLKK
jgi:heme-degrading monooxygenase HmoA